MRYRFHTKVIELYGKPPAVVEKELNECIARAHASSDLLDVQVQSTFTWVPPDDFARAAEGPLAEPRLRAVLLVIFKSA